LKQKLICLICFVVGGVVAYSSSYGGQFKQMLNFVGAMIITGAFIFIDEWVMNYLFHEKRNSALVQLRLLLYVGLGILFLNLSSLVNLNLQMQYMGKAFGISFLILAMWKFYSFTTIKK